MGAEDLVSFRIFFSIYIIFGMVVDHHDRLSRIRWPDIYTIWNIFKEDSEAHIINFNKCIEEISNINILIGAIETILPDGGSTYFRGSVDSFFLTVVAGIIHINTFKLFNL